jgi:hypothetical protein
MLVESPYPMGGVATTVDCTVEMSSAATARRTHPCLACSRRPSHFIWNLLFPTMPGEVRVRSGLTKTVWLLTRLSR